MAALMITFPRQLQIIQSIFAFFNLFISWSGSFNQLKSLGKIIDFSETKTDTQKYIQFYEIDFLRNQEKRNFGDFSALVDAIYKEQNGRWTLRGRNGSGKSTLLCLLKEKFGEEGFFLPTHYEDLCFSSEFLNESDGNRLAAVFEMISKIENVKFIILDEWDANLDEHNLNQINAAIDRLAKNRIVLESRHRG